MTGLSTPPVLTPLAPNFPWQMAINDQGLRRSEKRDRDDVTNGAIVEDRPHRAPQRTATGRDADSLIDPLPPSRAERERQKAAEEAARNAAARNLFDKGVKAEESGKEGVARVYFEMAAKRATGSFKEEVERRLEVTFPPMPTRRR